ncbi:MAG: cation diffusion facilitator family transporter [Pseudomonadota bacterium]
MRLSVRSVLVVEGLANSLVLALKVIAGVWSGSSAILADAVHSLLDLVNNGLAFLASRISDAPPDKNHPYGHKKFEWLAVFVLATLLSVTAIEIAIRAIERISTDIRIDLLSISLMSAVLGLNLCLAIGQRYFADKLGSDLLLADAQHTLGDVFTTVVVILGTLLASRGFPWIDTLLALAVSGLVLYLAFGLFKRAIPILVDESGLDNQRVIRDLRAIEGVEDVLRVRSRRVGSDIFADLVITVSPDLDTVYSHRVADRVEAFMRNELSVADVIVHVEPSEVS